MGVLRIVDTGILFINPDPSRYHVWAATAHPVALSDTEFIATYQRGAAMYAADSDMAVTRSHDGGVTWAHERFIHDKRGDDRPYSYHDAQLGQMKDGELVALAFRIDRSDPDQPMFSAAGGLLPVQCVLFKSHDDGAT
jgi:FAD/FMN-containing dehydrogenase